jgi:hypothetical protein
MTYPCQYFYIIKPGWPRDHAWIQYFVLQHFHPICAFLDCHFFSVFSTSSVPFLNCFWRVKTIDSLASVLCALESIARVPLALFSWFHTKFNVNTVFQIKVAYFLVGYTCTPLISATGLTQLPLQYSNHNLCKSKHALTF